MAEEEDRFARYNRLDSEQEVVYRQPGPLDKVQELAPAAKSHAKKIIIAIVVIIIAYFVLDFFVLSIKQFSISVTDLEGTPLPTSSLKIFQQNSSEPVFFGSSDSSYSVPLKKGTYSFEASAGTNYKKLMGEISLSKEKETMEIKLEKNMDVEITAFSFPSELYLGQEAAGTVTLTNRGDKTESVQLVFEQGLKELGKSSVVLEPETITMLSKQPVDATIKITVPTAGISIKNKATGDQKKATIRIKYLNEKSEADFTLYPEPNISFSTTDFSATVNADGENHNIKDIGVTNNAEFPVKDVSFSIEDDGETKNWFSFPAGETISSLGAKKSGNNKGEVKLWARIPIGTRGGDRSVVILVNTAGQTKKITMKLTVKEVKLDFIASASRDTVNITKRSGVYDEIISESIELENKGIVDIQNVDLVADIGCRNNFITFPQGSHFETIRKGFTETVAMRITAPSATAANEKIPCKITVSYDDPVTAVKRQQVINLFLVTK